MMIASLGYEDGGNFIHSPSNEDMLSVSFDVLKGNGFPVCQTVDFTISPFLLALGVVTVTVTVNTNLEREVLLRKNKHYL